jgi:hypothetical protein
VAPGACVLIASMPFPALAFISYPLLYIPPAGTASGVSASRRYGVYLRILWSG